MLLQRNRAREKQRARIGFQHLRTASAIVLTSTAWGAATAQTPERPAATASWPVSGHWLKADFHTQTTFSDGAHSVEEVVAAAEKHGCDVVAITDHADGNLRAGTPEYVDAIHKARLEHPSTIVLAGMEWNVPPGKGREHATVLFPSRLETSEAFSAFKERFDDQTKKGDDGELAVQALTSLMDDEPSKTGPVVFFNHPSRRPDSTSAPRLTFDALKKSAPELLIGFEGAPGHQRATPLGAYVAGVSPIDRWDPLAAETNGAWDRWLRQGLNVWAAIANSDFHNEREDFWPCEFAATWVYASDRSIDGILGAMRTGSFFAEHGHIASQVELSAWLEGRSAPIRPGETAVTSAGTRATVSMQMMVPATDYAGRQNHIDTVELIGIGADQTDILVKGSPEETEAFRTVITVPDGGIVLRARGRRIIDGEPALMFYTNPIRIMTR